MPKTVHQDRLADVRSVRFRYVGHADYLLREVNLQICPGEIVMLAGPNGSGKSTLHGLISGRLLPSAGTVEVLGANPAKASRAPAIGLVSEPFHPNQSPLPVDLSVRQVLKWLRILDSVSTTAIDELCQTLYLPNRLFDQPIRLLSKGERQRVVLLVALLRRPRLLLADEPLEGLDQETRLILGQTLRRFADGAGRGVLWTSHHVSETLPYADRLLELDNGKVVERSATRFCVRITDGSGYGEEATLASLQALPGIVEEALRSHKHVRLDVTASIYGDETK